MIVERSVEKGKKEDDGKEEESTWIFAFWLGILAFSLSHVIFVVTCDVMTGTVQVHHIPEIEFI